MKKQKGNVRKQSLIIHWSMYWNICYISNLSKLQYYVPRVSLTADGSIRISLIMCERLPQVAIIAVHLCAHGHRRESRQETWLYVDLLIYEGANRGGCDGGGRAGAAPPPQPACSANTKSHLRTFTLRKLSVGFNRLKSPQSHRVSSKVKGGTATTICKSAVSQPFYQNISYITQTLRRAAKV